MKTLEFIIQKIVGNMIDIITNTEGYFLQILLFFGVAAFFILFISIFIMFAVMIVLTLLDVIIIIKNFPKFVYEKYVLFSNRKDIVIFNKFSFILEINNGELILSKIKKGKVKSISKGSVFITKKIIFTKQF